MTFWIPKNFNNQKLFQQNKGKCDGPMSDKYGGFVGFLQEGSAVLHYRKDSTFSVDNHFSIKDWFSRSHCYSKGLTYSFSKFNT